MKIALINIILIGYFTLTINAQSFEKGGISIGGNANIHLIDNKKYSEKNTNINIDLDFGYMITHKSFLGFRLDLYLFNEKGKEYYSHKNDWMSSYYYRTLLIDAIYIDIFGGYGKHYFKYESKDGFHGFDKIHMAQFGAGIGFPKFLTPNIILNPVISYNHKIMFVKNLGEYPSNQHFNNIIIKVGLYYYFNTNQKIKNYENTN